MYFLINYLKELFYVYVSIRGRSKTLDDVSVVWLLINTSFLIARWDGVIHHTKLREYHFVKIIETFKKKIFSESRFLDYHERINPPRVFRSESAIPKNVSASRTYKSSVQRPGHVCFKITNRVQSNIIRRFYNRICWKEWISRCSALDLLCNINHPSKPC